MPLLETNDLILSADDASSERYVRKVTWIGLIINLVLTAFKFVAGILGSSQAVVADAIHSLSDCTTDIAVILGSHYWSRPPDEGHPYGHRRIETLVTIFIGVILMGAAIGIGWEGIVTLQKKHAKPPGWIAFLAAAISIVCKEILYRWTAAAGRRVKSAAMVANAWHHRSDAFSSIPVLIAVGGAMISPSWTFLDHLGAVVVSIFIFQAAFKIIWPGLRELIDAGAPKETCERVKAIIYKNKAIKQVHRIRTRYVSNFLQVDLHIVVDGKMTVLEGHDIAEEIRIRVLAEEPDVVDVVVHVDPTEAALPEEEC